jgi:hypothetical protein
MTGSRPMTGSVKSRQSAKWAKWGGLKIVQTAPEPNGL